MKKVLTVALIALIAILGCVQTVNAYSVDMTSKTPKEVECGETFTLTVAVDENTPLANGHIEYDTKLFEFVKANQTNMSAQSYASEGYVSWMYTDTNTGAENYTFEFKAKDIPKTTTGQFKLTDAVFIAESEETYEGDAVQGQKTVDVTVKAKEKSDEGETTNKEEEKNTTTTESDKTSGNKDNTTTTDTKLPQTGKGLLLYGVIAVALIALVFKFKHKKISKLFTFAILTIMISTSVVALKLADTEKYQAGLLDSLIEGEKVVAINPGKSYYTNENLTLEMLQSLFSEENLTIDTIKDFDGNKVENKIATGNKVILTDKSEYTVLLYGDANGDGSICNAADVNVIREEYVRGEKADDIYRIAADLSPDGILNVKDVAIIVKKYTGKHNVPLVNPFPDDDYELPKQKIEDENVLKIDSVDTTSNSVTINIELNTTGLTPNRLTYEIYKAVDGEENIAVNTYTILDLEDLSHTFENLDANTEYFVIVTLDAEEAQYYAQQTITTKPESTDEPVTPPDDEPDEPSDRKIEAEFIVSNVKSGSAEVEIVLADETTLEDDDKIFFGSGHGTYGGQSQFSELSGTIQNLDAGKEYQFWAQIQDKDGNILWDSGKQNATTPEITFDLTAEKDTEDSKTKINASISNVNSDEFDFEKIECMVYALALDDEGNMESGTLVLNETITELTNKITIDKLTPGTAYKIKVKMYDTVGNYTEKEIAQIATDKNETTEPNTRELEGKIELVSREGNKAKVKVIATKGQLESTDTYQFYFTTQTKYPISSETAECEITLPTAANVYTLCATVTDVSGNTYTMNPIQLDVIEITGIDIVETANDKITTSVKIYGPIGSADKIVAKIEGTNYTNQQEITFPTTTTTFNNLTANTEYSVWYEIQDEHGNTVVVSEKQNVTTESVVETPTDPDTQYTATLALDELSLTTSSVTAMLEVLPNLDKYSVKYFVNGTVSYNSENPYYHFENLKAGETYAFWAEVYDKDGNKIATTDIITQEMPSPDVKVDVENDSQEPSSTIVVSAQPETMNDTFSLESYKVIVSEVNSTDGTYKIVKATDEISGDALIEHKISGLEPNTNYLVTVYATDQGGNIATSSATITTTEEPRELEGKLELVSRKGNTIDTKISITKGQLEETDTYVYSVNKPPKQSTTSENSEHKFTILTTPDYYILSASVVDADGNSYIMESLTVQSIAITDLTLNEKTKTSIASSIQLEGPVGSTNKITAKIEGPDGYTNEKTIKYPTTSCTFGGLTENTQYTIWYEVEDEYGNVIATSDKLMTKTAREFDAELELVSTNKDGQATVKLNITKGKLLDTDTIKYAWIYSNEPFTGDFSTQKGTQTYTFTGLPTNEQINLLVWVFDEQNTEIEQIGITTTIRKVEITQFGVKNGIAKNVIAAEVKSEATGTISTDNIVYEVRNQGSSSYISENGELGDYTYKNLISGQTYYFRLKIYDEEWNLLAESDEIEHTVQKPSINLILTKDETKPSTQILARIEDPKETIGCVPDEYDYYVYKVNSDGSITEVKRNLGYEEFGWLITDLLPNTTYEIKAVAKDTKNNTSATATNRITTAEAVDTVIITMQDATIENYDPRDLDYKQVANIKQGVLNITGDYPNDIKAAGTIKVIISDNNDENNDKNPCFPTPYGITSDAVDYSISTTTYTNDTLNINIKDSIALFNLSNMPIAYYASAGLEDGDKITFEIDTSGLTTSPREDITLEGQTKEVLVKYRVDEIPEIELIVDYELGADSATATIDVTNLAKIDTYYYKLYRYNKFGNNSNLVPVEPTDGNWIEYDNNKYTFENLDEGYTYLVVAQAKSTQGNYAGEELSYEFTTNNFVPDITVNATSTATQIAAKIDTQTSNEATIKNYQLAVIDRDTNHQEDGKAKYIEMPVSENKNNSYPFKGLYPNTDYTVFAQATSDKDVMSNYINRNITTKVIRDTLDVAEQTTTDSITVTADTTNLKAALEEIQQAGIYDIDLDECAIIYHCNPVEDGQASWHYTTYGLDLEKEITYTYVTTMISGKSYELWVEITDENDKLIWTTKQLETDPETGEETGEESGDIVELEALNIASMEVNRKQEYSLDMRVKLDEESRERIANNVNTSYTYKYEVWTTGSTNSQGPGLVTSGTVSKANISYTELLEKHKDEVNMNFGGKYYSDYDEEGDYTGDIIHMEGLDPNTTYIVVIIVYDANGGESTITDGINRQNLTTRADIPVIQVEYDYQQIAYDSDEMDAEELNRIATATAKVMNDAVIDYEYLELSGFNFKLYNGETVNEHNLVNPTKQTIRYYYNENATDDMTTLEKTLAREKAADSTKHLQTWEYKVSDLTIDQSYLWNVKAISRVGKESEIASHAFTAVWNTVNLSVNVSQDTAQSVILHVYNMQSPGIPAVEQYTINVVKLEGENGVVTDSNGDVTSFNWVEGEAAYTNTFDSTAFTGTGTAQHIEVTDIKNLDLDSQYVIIVEALAENGTTRTYYELIDTTAVAKVFSMGNEKFYTTLQTAVNSAYNQSTVYLLTDIKENITITNESGERFILKADDGKTLTGNVKINHNLKSKEVIFEEINIVGKIVIENSTSSAQLGNNVSIINASGYAIENIGGEVNILGKNIKVKSANFVAIYNTQAADSQGLINITSSANTNEEKIEISSLASAGILNEGTAEIEGKYIDISGATGIVNSNSLTVNSTATTDDSKINIVGEKECGIYNGETSEATITGNAIEIIGTNCNGITNHGNLEVNGNGIKITGNYEQDETTNIDSDTEVPKIFGIQNSGEKAEAKIMGSNIEITGNRSGLNNEGTLGIDGENIIITGNNRHGIFNQWILNISGENITIIGNTNCGISNYGENSKTTIEGSNIEITGNHSGLNNEGTLGIDGEGIEITGETMGIVNSGERSTLDISGEEIIINGNIHYGISNQGVNSQTTIEGSNIEITGETTGILNLGERSTLDISGEEIIINGNIHHGISNQGVNSQTTIEGSNIEITGEYSGILNYSILDISGEGITINGNASNGISNQGTNSQTTIEGSNIEITGETAGILNLGERSTLDISGEEIIINGNTYYYGISNQGTNSQTTIEGSNIEITGEYSGILNYSILDISGEGITITGTTADGIISYGKTVIVGKNITITGEVVGISNYGGTLNITTPDEVSENGIKIVGNTLRGIYNDGETASTTITGKCIDIVGYEDGIFNDVGNLIITTSKTSTANYEEEAMLIRGNTGYGLNNINDAGGISITLSSDGKNKELILEGGLGAIAGATITDATNRILERIIQ